MSNLSIKSTNPNYLAKIVCLPELKKHPNADRLQICVLFGNSIITGLDAKEGDLYIYCPLESCLDSQFLSWSNSYTDSVLNNDITKKGFFDKNSRVKACRLRSSRSEGYIFPAKELNAWLGKEIINEKDVNTDFDTINDRLFIQKYVNKQDIINAQKLARAEKKGKKARESRIIEGQFAFHRDTRHLGREIYNIEPNDLVSWTEKLHGSSGICGKVLCKKSLSWYEKIFKFLGVKIQDTHYDYLWSSRTVIKNQYADKKSIGFYDSDIWKIAAEKLIPSIKDGITLYFEIVGFTPTGAAIQKRYDYACEQGQLDIYIYRITYTSPTNDVWEFSWPQIKDYCQKYLIKHVPEHFYGKAKDMFPELDLGEHWHENFIQALSDKYLEKECFLCKNKVPNEGGVLRKETGGYQPFKHKSFKFKELESKELDTGEVNIEDIS